MVLDDTSDPFTGPSTRTLDNIVARPPTPPKESPRSKKSPGTLSSTSGDTLESSPTREISPSTFSNESHSGLPAGIAGDITKSGKKVTWSGFTHYHQTDAPLTPTASRVRPSAETETKSLKSILKQTPKRSGDYIEENLEEPEVAFPTMLESVVQALASTERSKKLDTYISFSNALKAYDVIPDFKAMEAKIPALCGFLKRDLSAKMPEGGNADAQLMSQAVKLLTIICWYDRFIACMDEATAGFFVQFAIQKIEDPSSSKATINAFMHFLAQQRFLPRTMTADRAGRIIAVLETLDERCTGKSITRERLGIYMKLLQQAKGTMLAKAPNWIQVAFSGILNNIKEVRQHALSLLMDAAKVLGKEKAMARAVSGVFNQTHDGKPMFESIKSRLEYFLSGENEGAYVSQLWACILLLTQSVCDKWDFFTLWLRIIELCFNVSVPDVKVEAQLAWAKLIYCANIGPNTQRKLLELMCRPIAQYLNPQNATLNTRRPRKAAISNICAYLYHGFRPNAVPKQLSEIWDVVVVGLIKNLVLAGTEAPDGCLIISALFDGTTPKKWTEDRLLSTENRIVKIDEVPRLNPVWVRANSGKILKVIQVALDKGSWKEPDAGSRLLWSRFCQTLADAGSKEIKIAPELMEAVSHIFNMLKSLWTRGVDGSEANPEISFMEKFGFLVETAVDALGTLCFTERQLGLDKQSKFVPAGTPNTKVNTEGNNGQQITPLLHILRLLMEPPPGVVCDEEYLQCAKNVLAKCVAAQDSRRKKLALLGSCEAILPTREVKFVHLGLWGILAELTRGALVTQSRERALLSPSPAGTEFKDAVTILKRGFQRRAPGWEPLFKELTTVVQGELGDGFVSTNVIGPIAELIRYSETNESNMTQSIQQVITLLEKAAIAKKKITIDGMLKGSALAENRKPAISDALEPLYALSNSLLLKSYESSDRDLRASGMELFTAAVTFIARAPAGTLNPLRQMQEGLGVWAWDPSRIVNINNGLNANSATKIWEKLLPTIQSLPRHDSEMLSNLEALLSCGLESRRKGTVNATITTWNATFGKQSSLTYPSRLRTALAKIKTISDISLPTFPQDDSGIYTPPVFESQDSFEPHLGLNDDIPSSPTPHRPASVADFMDKMKTPATPRRRLAAKGRQTPSKSRTPSKSKAKPKHMDSQIDFIPVEHAEPETQDSQLITEHQKEVRKEQAEAATAFQEVSGTIKPRQRKVMRRGSPSPAPPTPVTKEAQENDTLPEIVMNEQAAEKPPPPSSFVLESKLSSQVPLTKESLVPLADITNGGSKERRLSAISDIGSDLTDIEMSRDEIPPIVNDKPAADKEISPPKEVPEIANLTVAISPAKDKAEYVIMDSDTEKPSSPDAQIQAEIKSNTSPAVASKKRPEKRKREALAPPESPEMENSITVASEPIFSTAASFCSEEEDNTDDIVMAESPAHTRSVKRTKLDPEAAPPASQATPTRISSRSTKGKKPRKLLVDSSDVNGSDPVVSTPTRGRGRPRKETQTQTQVQTPKKTKLQLRLEQEAAEENEEIVVETQLDQIDVAGPETEMVPEMLAPPQQTRVAYTPTKQNQKPMGLFPDDTDVDELQVSSPRHSVSEVDQTGRPGSARRRRRKRITKAKEFGESQKSGETQSQETDIAVVADPVPGPVTEPMKDVVMEAGEEQMVEQAKEGLMEIEPTSALSTTEVGPSRAPEGAAMATLRSALAALESTELSIEAINAAEEEMFEAYAKLRARKRSMKLMKDIR